MPDDGTFQVVIPCSDCAARRTQLEQEGVFAFVSCAPLPDQDRVPAGERQCLFVYRLI